MSPREKWGTGHRDPYKKANNGETHSPGTKKPPKKERKARTSQQASGGGTYVSQAGDAKEGNKTGDGGEAPVKGTFGGEKGKTLNQVGNTVSSRDSPTKNFTQEESKASRGTKNEDRISRK